MNIRDVLYMRNTGKLRTRASIQDKFLARKLSGGGTETKTIDFTPVIFVSDAIAGNVIDYQCKITAKQTGTPSPQNICPIDGWTGAEITRAGINLFIAENPTSGYISGSDGTKKSSSSWYCSLTYSPVKGGTTYTLSKVGTGSSSVAGFAWYDENENFIGGETYGSWITKTITVPENARYFRASWGVNADNPIMLIPSGVTVPTEYTAYETPTVYLDTWQSEAGIVYGGVRNLTTGMLTVTHAIIDMGTLEWNRNTNYNNPVFYVSISGRAYGDNIYMMCDTYKDLGRTYTDAGTFANNAPDLSCACASNSSRVYIRDDSYTSGSAFQTAMNGHYIVYQLAEPQTYTLTPTEITIAEGANTIWADTGDSKLTYLAKK